MKLRILCLMLALWIASARLSPGGQNGPIHLKTRDLTAGSDPAVRALQAAGPGSSHLLVQLSRAPVAADLLELRRRGARVVGSAPDGGITISIDQPISFDGLPVEWAAPLLASDKISPLLAQADNDPAPVVIEFHPDVNRRRALHLLRDINVQILDHPDLAPNHVLVTATPEAFGQIAAFDEVAYIFPASNDLVQGNRVMACTGAEMSAGPVGQYVLMSAGWPAGIDGIVHLDYVFAQMSAKLPVAAAQSEIARALAEWAKYAKIQFVFGTSATAGQTVSIMFAQGMHGDAYPFDPGGPVLAHTFFPDPPNPEPIAGDMHLNEDQDWHIGSNIDLYTVALHEAGHALGLGHTDDPNTIMYPYYRFGAGLSSGDIAGVQALYGSPDGVAAPLTLAITTPSAASTTTTASSITIAGTSSGGTGKLQVVWSNSQGGSGPATGSVAWSIASVPLSLGTNTIMILANDAAGDTASATLTVTAEAPVTPGPPTSPAPPAAPPSGPPSLNITSPSMSIVSTSAGTIAFAGTASGSVTSVVWSNSTGTSGNATGMQSWTAPGIPLLVGTNIITIQAYNAAGASAWRAVTVVRQ